MICNLSCLTAMQKLHLSRKKINFKRELLLNLLWYILSFGSWFSFKVIKNICNFYQPILWNYNLCKLCINISVDQEGRKKPTEFPLITRVDIFPSVSVWIKVIDFIKIYILFRSLKLKVIRRHITGKKNLEIK